MTNTIELTSKDFKKVTKEGVSLIDFWAPWCGPCRMVAPVLEDLADDFKEKVKICKINTDIEQDLAIKYQVKSIPTLLFMKDGKIVNTLMGFQSKETLEKELNSILNH